MSVAIVFVFITRTCLPNIVWVMMTNILLVTSNFFLFCSKKVGKQSVPRLCKKFDSKERDKERERERERERDREREIIKRFLLFLIPCIRFLFESLKFTRKFSSRFDQIFGCSTVVRYYKIFERFIKVKAFLQPVLFSLLHWTKRISFFQTNLILNSNFGIVCSIVLQE